MSVFTLVTVTLKGADSTYKHSFPCYDSYSLIESDPVIAEYIKQSQEQYKAEVEEISVTAKLVVK